MLDSNFFNRPTLEVASDLLGKVIVRNGVKAVIVETEAYIGPVDKGCHAYHFKKTKRNEVMFSCGGVAYLYLIYGMYYCLNFVTEGEGFPCAVLIRSVEVVEGLDTACRRRYKKEYSQLSSRQIRNLSNGPGKVCMLFNLSSAQNGMSLQTDDMYIEDNGISGFDIVKAKRINIDYAEEARDFLWRFYIKGNQNISVK
ncbi:MAG: DNA-3-methyladenine glycosylase [Clostridia bacterium]|nr:DNA-3-methyladenine glycosylase [Clostridia bacterium]